ncbi:transposase family protein [Rhizobium sp. SEMIA 4085]|uniref:transposase family protein n=2 Tax=Rhizobium TaxID=379 RepID=UPI0032B1A62E
MSHSLRPSTLVPRGFIVDNTAIDDKVMLIAVRSASKASLCPICGTRSERIHSRYQRRLADLPLVGKPVRLVIEATVPLRRSVVRPANLRRALRRGRSRAFGAANCQARPHRPSSRACIGRQASGHLCQEADIAGKQRYAAARRAAARQSALCPADRDRDRRLCVAT